MTGARCASTGEKNYPWKTRTKSTYDIELPDATEDAQYLDMLQHWLPLLYERHAPQLVFFQAGVDAMVRDSFGRLSLTRAGLQQRNQMVLSAALEVRMHALDKVVDDTLHES
jgi:acetoin utilization deacetylase AcuC-like enzyme